MGEKFWQRNTILKTLSILVAIVMWLYVTGQANPTAETVINVPLETRSLASDMVIEDKPATVTVRLEGKKQVIETVSSRDIRALVDLRGANLGGNLLSVEVLTPQNVDLVSVEPKQAEVTIDEISDRQMPVTVSFTGRPSSEYVTLEPVLTPSQVLVTGPRNVLEHIERTYVTIDLERVGTNITENLPIKVEDSSGNTLMEWVRVIPETVEVFVPVVEDKPNQTMLVKPTLEGELAEGFAIKRIVTEPEMVKVYGNLSVLLPQQYLGTTPVDISDAEGNIQQQVQLELPPGVTPSVFTPIHVFIEIGPQEEQDENQVQEQGQEQEKITE